MPHDFHSAQAQAAMAILYGADAAAQASRWAALEGRFEAAFGHWGRVRADACSVSKWDHRTSEFKKIRVLTFQRLEGL